MTESSGTRRPAAVLGAGGYIGQTFLQRLDGHPWFDTVELVGGPRSEGRRLSDVWQLAEPPPEALAERRLSPLRTRTLARGGIELVFSGLPSGTAGPVERELARRGIAVFSNASDLRGAPGAPLLVPEVNPEHLRVLGTPGARRGFVVTNPNCSATGLVLALAPWRRLLAPRRVHVATYQSLSGAGYPGVASLAITDNVLPFIDREEEKLAEETCRLFGTVSPRGRVRPLDLPVLAHCARVATREGHLEAVTVEAGRRPALAELRKAAAAFDPLRSLQLPSAPHPPVILRPEADRPQPLRDRFAGHPHAARGMAVSVGRLRWEPPFLRCFVLVHNAIRGGAGGSILNAELVHALGGYLP